MPAALVAAGVMAVSGAALATGQGGIPSSIAGVYAQGTIVPTSYMAITRNMYSPLGTDAPTATGGFMMVLLKPTQTAWGYALTSGSGGTDTGGTATLSHSLTTGTTTCTATYKTVYDSQGTMAVSMASVAASPATATSTCKTAFANQTGLPAAFYTPTGSTESKTFNLIY